jgi:hypothetical protein
MRNGLLMVERLIIESLGKTDKNLSELSRDTNLGKDILLNILPLIMTRNIVQYKRGVYSLNEFKKLEWRADINDPTSVKDEVKELFTSMVNTYYSDSEERALLKLKKMWLTLSEKRILNSLLFNVEQFVKNIEKDRLKKPEKEKLCENQVIFWGTTEYSSLIQDALQLA